MRVVITADYQSLSHEAAHLVAGAVKSTAEAVLGLPTGSTPLGMYAELVNMHRADGLDFSRVHTFNLDEYIGLPAGHPDSYHSYMRTHFFGPAGLSLDRTDIPDGLAGTNAGAECARYEEAIRRCGGIDLLIVGIAANGHIAFNEPGSSFISRTRVVTLAPETIANARKYFARVEDVPQYAITMGIGTILEARRIVLLASGNGKAEAVKRALKGPVSEAMPASALQLHKDVIAIVDEAASK